jgi:hypothetical protein
MKIEQIDIADIIGKLAQSPVRGTAYHRQLEELFRLFAGRGVALETVRDAQHLAMSEHTARAYAREFKLSFPDYVPRELRPKKEKKAEAA